jgi:glyoxylase-like metal-dependent hydrolase (beta-lactamase superfamily II)
MELTSNLHAFLWNSTNVNNCNTYLIKTPQKNILIDPGLAPYFDHVSHGLSQLGLSIKDIDLVICTHAHPDHIDAVHLFDTTQTLFAIHEIEWRRFMEEASYLTAMNVDLTRFNPAFFLNEGELKVGEIVLDVFHTPGHTPGSVTLYWKDANALFTGDLIFKDGLGRTDLSGGNGTQLKDSIRRMAALDTEWLLSGHGDIVSGTDKVKANFEQVEQLWFRYI